MKALFGMFKIALSKQLDWIEGKVMDRGALIVLMAAIAFALSANAADLGHSIRLHKGHHSTVKHESEPKRICWRYYGGPKGGVWPVPCGQ